MNSRRVAVALLPQISRFAETPPFDLYRSIANRHVFSPYAVGDVSWTGAESLPGIEELADVELVSDQVVDGSMLPRGSEGTVVHVYRSGKTFEVEFSQPVHALATLRRADIRPLRR